EGPPDELSAPRDHAGEDVEILFGESVQGLTHRVHQGDLDSALDALQAICLANARRLRSSRSQLPPAGPQERRLLTRLAGMPPAVRGEEGVDVHRWEAGFPMLVATAQVAADVAVVRQGDSAPDDGQPTTRVVTWGLAVPSGDNAWRLLSLRPRHSSESVVDENDAAPLWLPTAAEHVMTVRGADRTAMTVFRAEGADRALIDAWMIEFDRRFGDTARSSDWAHTDGSWMRNFSTVGRPGIYSVTLSLDQQTGEARGVHVASETGGHDK
ncbi:MAG: hypothetical protein WEA31_01475, partial [Pirellulales bacterium]